MGNLEALEAIVRRFGSAPVVHVTLSSVLIRVGFPAIFASALENVTSVSLIGCSYDPVALKKFVGGFGCIDEVWSTSSNISQRSITHNCVRSKGGYNSAMMMEPSQQISEESFDGLVEFA